MPLDGGKELSELLLRPFYFFFSFQNPTIPLPEFVASRRRAGVRPLWDIGDNSGYLELYSGVFALIQLLWTYLFLVIGKGRSGQWHFVLPKSFQWLRVVEAGSVRLYRLKARRYAQKERLFRGVHLTLVKLHHLVCTGSAFLHLRFLSLCKARS